MTYKHGISISEVPTSVIPPVEAMAGLPVVVGTAPIHLAEDQNYVNRPFLAHTYPQAVKALGYSPDWGKYSLSEAMKSHLDLFGVAPVVFINVLDPATHKKSVTDSTINITSGTAVISQDGVLLSTLVVKLTAAGQPLIKDTDYTASFNAKGEVVVTPISGGAIPGNQITLAVSYMQLDPSKVTKADIIGGVNPTTGAYSGLELVNRVFPLFRLVPGQILAPGWSEDPTVAAVMKAKAKNINGLFKAMAITDIPASSAGADLYAEVPAWKSTNKYNDPFQVACWPKVKFGSEVYHLSTQFAGIACRTDSQNDDIPFVSPSNRNLHAAGAVVDGGSEVSLGPDQAAYLNGEGIVTALNFTGGWKLWGNRTAAYPDNTDVKDSFISVRRMFNWVGNTIVLTFGERVDSPTNRRMIDTVVDSLNIWLNGLCARGALLGGRVEFRADENPASDLINGIIRFHVALAPPVPGEELQFALEFDVNYLNALFSA
ncbi:phage tail sheath family protein [Paenibacillus ehimensis]|uniref:phage tail sheath family protein n=1 Tax=Paenibacillus ehimensis TaxID=79264 RepID=UPI000470E3AC|nr:phage tail protein [Paenibacillus ehimensis]